MSLTSDFNYLDFIDTNESVLISGMIPRAEFLEGRQDICAVHISYSKKWLENLEQDAVKAEKELDYANEQIKVAEVTSNQWKEQGKAKLSLSSLDDNVKNSLQRDNNALDLINYDEAVKFTASYDNYTQLFMHALSAGLVGEEMVGNPFTYCYENNKKIWKHYGDNSFIASNKVLFKNDAHLMGKPSAEVLKKAYEKA